MAETRLILHLGDHKTGSTSIQQALSRGQAEVEGEQIVYPTIENGSNHAKLGRTLVHHRLFDQRETIWGALAEQVQAAPTGSTIIISAENFERADPALVREMLETYLPDHAGTAELMLYLRPHGPRLVSSYGEGVKQGLFQGTLRDYHAHVIERGPLFYAPRLGGWRAAFGPRFQARLMQRDRLKNGDVVADFLEAVFPGAPQTITAPVAANESVSLEDLAVLHAVQEALQDIRVKKADRREPLRALGWRLARMLAATAKGGGTRLQLDRALAEDLQATYGADAAETDAAFFDGTPLSDSLATLPDTACAAPQSIDLADLVSPETYRVCKIWIQLLHDIYQLNPGDWLGFFQANPLRAEQLSTLMQQIDAGPDGVRDDALEEDDLEEEV